MSLFDDNCRDKPKSINEYDSDFYPKGICGMQFYDLLLHSVRLNLGEQCWSSKLHPERYAKILAEYKFYLN